MLKIYVIKLSSLFFFSLLFILNGIVYLCRLRMHLYCNKAYYSNLYFLPFYCYLISLFLWKKLKRNLMN
ncbi:MAG TPA: hypothetical protein DEF61_03820 [Firmicutes bacterium]|nr:hypothetical protein [Bacillota bacterium]